MDQTPRSSNTLESSCQSVSTTTQFQSLSPAAKTSTDSISDTTNTPCTDSQEFLFFQTLTWTLTFKFRTFTHYKSPVKTCYKMSSFQPISTVQLLTQLVRACRKKLRLHQSSTLLFLRFLPKKLSEKFKHQMES